MCSFFTLELLLSLFFSRQSRFSNKQQHNTRPTGVALPSKKKARSVLIHLWTPTDDANLEALVDESKGGTNQDKLRLTWAKIAAFMADFSDDGTVYTEQGAKRRWSRLRAARKEAAAKDEAAIRAVEGIGEEMAGD